MPWCECCDCGASDQGLISSDPPCEFFGVGLSFVNSGYVGNACFDTKQEQLNVAGAAFWLYGLNIGIANYPMDEMMFTPSPKYTSTLENAFVDNQCFMSEAFEEEDLTVVCSIWFKLQEFFKDCCNTNPPIGKCLDLPEGAWSGLAPYVEQAIVIFGGSAWIRSRQNPASVAVPGAALGEWWECGTTEDCNTCWDDPTYPYWFISLDTFPTSGFRYEFWSEGSSYNAGDKVVYDGYVWRQLIGVFAGWANRPGGTPGQWEKLN